MDKLEIKELLIDNVPDVPPSKDTSNEEPIDPQPPYLTCSPDPTKTTGHK
jgi:hypothetical protein